MAEASVKKDGQQALKYTVTHHRQPQHSHEDFIKWIVEEHLPVAIPIFKRHGVLSYQLFVTPATLNGALKQELGKLRPTWDFAEYDCIIEYTMTSMEAIKNVMSDPEWPAATKDQDEWVDMSRALISLGYATPYLLETGEAVNLK